MSDNEIRIERHIPVLYGYDHQTLLGRASIVRTPAVKSRDDRGVLVELEPEKLVITIESTGESAQNLGNWITTDLDLVALSFSGIPAQQFRPPTD